MAKLIYGETKQGISYNPETIDKLLKKHAALQDLNNELVEALSGACFASIKQIESRLIDWAIGNSEAKEYLNEHE